MAAKQGKVGVYFVGARDYEDVPVKIGMTTNITERLKGLATSSPLILELLAFYYCSTQEDAYEMEQYFHRQFGNWRSHGEWFKPNPELSELLDQRRLSAEDRAMLTEKPVGCNVRGIAKIKLIRRLV